MKPVKATQSEMVGEFFREISAPVLVFAPLDRLIAEGSVSPEWWGGTLLLSLILFLLGVAFENVG